MNQMLKNIVNDYFFIALTGVSLLTTMSKNMVTSSMKYFVVFLLVLFNTQARASSLGFEYKGLGEFRLLSSYNTIEEFEGSYAGYVKDCLDMTGGGTGGIPCFIGSQLWDRELNEYYKKLASLLNKKEIASLKESQRAWIKERDLSVDLNAEILDRKYS